MLPEPLPPSADTQRCGMKCDTQPGCCRARKLLLRRLLLVYAGRRVSPPLFMAVWILACLKFHFCVLTNPRKR